LTAGIQNIDKTVEYTVRAALTSMRKRIISMDLTIT
jgi:hypothetical protein